MSRRTTLALAIAPAATIALALQPAVAPARARTPAATAASAAPTTVNVRVEGLRRTLLSSTRVRTRGGWITRGGAPRGSCPAAGAAGALDLATRHDWVGSYQSFGLSVVSILGERHTFSSPDYWSIFVNGRYASAGICDLRLTRGEQLLFAAVPDKGNAYPILLSAPRRVVAGHAFDVSARYYGARGGARPLAGVKVSGGAVTNARGVATVTLRRSGRVRLTASRARYIRAEATVAVGS
ncbi:MAG: hypothetical protein ACRDMX_13370 [Solirubrobacteraceae bacterium]